MIDPQPGADELRKGAALIRSIFNVDPFILSDEEFADLLCEAIWVEQYKADLFEHALLKVMGKVFGKQS